MADFISVVWPLTSSIHTLPFYPLIPTGVQGNKKASFSCTGEIQIMQTLSLWTPPVNINKTNKQTKKPEPTACIFIFSPALFTTDQIWAFLREFFDYLCFFLFSVHWYLSSINFAETHSQHSAEDAECPNKTIGTVSRMPWQWSSMWCIFSLSLLTINWTNYIQFSGPEWDQPVAELVWLCLGCVPLYWLGLAVLHLSNLSWPI